MAFQFWRQRPDPRPGKTRYLTFSEGLSRRHRGQHQPGRDRALPRPVRPPALPDRARLPIPTVTRCPLGLQRDRCQVDCAAAAEELVRRHHEELAAVVVEPLVQGAAGMIVAPEGYLRRLREVTRRHEVLLIADEVAVGFGRTGTMFACEQEGVVPDFLCVAKGLTGGYLPLAATLTTHEVYSAFLGRPEEGAGLLPRPYLHRQPPGRGRRPGQPGVVQHPADARRAAAEDRAVEALVGADERAAGGRRRAPERDDGRGRAGARPEYQGNRTPPPCRWAKRSVWRARKRGALLRPLGNVVVIMPPLAIEEALLDRLCEIVYQSIEEVCGAARTASGFLSVTAGRIRTQFNSSRSSLYLGPSPLHLR